ncbi:RNA polymerase sigma factor [Aneurinibacillus migulanus]|uniref:RNA polymerase sigma factor n=1 Tax=Aneurinibacillus migulanus TaxID=47500 RepID=UPI0006960EBE|nr:RNA polymerase sigma factor [Aneurinibacillus migulanus]MCP1356444.1 RNA polymerase sigma factor [Aneurinibacillus migulanus]
MAFKAAVHLAKEDLNEQFGEIIKSYSDVLRRYCLAITRSSWEAEDLMQETWLKAFVALTKQGTHSNPKAFLFRIASNTWIDKQRKQKVILDNGIDINTLAQENEEHTEEIKEALEIIVRHLPVKQQAVFLLTEAFKFTAAETAEMLEMTEGAVKAALNRARVKLRLLRESGLSYAEEKAYTQIIEDYRQILAKYQPEKIVLLTKQTYAGNTPTMLLAVA